MVPFKIPGSRKPVNQLLPERCLITVSMPARSQNIWPSIIIKIMYERGIIGPTSEFRTLPSITECAWISVPGSPAHQIFLSIAIQILGKNGCGLAWPGRSSSITCRTQPWRESN